MIKSILKFLLVILYISGFSFANAQAQIKGKLLNCMNCQVMAVVDKSNFDPHKDFVPASPDSYGNFVFDLKEIHRPTVVLLRIQDQPIPVFLKPNAKLWVTVRKMASGKLDFTFSGDLEKANEHLYSLYNEYDWVNNRTQNGIWLDDVNLNIGNRVYANFLSKADSLRYEHLIGESNNFISNANLAKGYDVDYEEYIADYVKYMNIATTFSLLKPDNLNLNQLQAIEQWKATFDFEETSMHIPSFIPALRAYIDFELRLANLKEADFNTQFDFIWKNVRYIPVKLKENLLYSMLEDYMTASTVKRLEPLLTPFVKSLSSLDKMHSLLSLYESAKEAANGRKAPGFTLIDTSGQQVSLSDFEGKNVFLAFWSSNCKPCIDGMIKSVKNKSLLSKEDIFYVYISTDATQSQWKRSKYVRGKGQKDVHLYAGLSAIDIKEYNAISLPTYYFIDRRGNFVSNFPYSWEVDFVEFVKSSN